MRKRLPKFSDKSKICIICEGKEEYQYLLRLKALNVWHDQYNISLVDAGGGGNISAIYQDKYQTGAFKIVFIFCDTEKVPYEQYEGIKRRINEFHGVDNAADEVIIFGNPCTLQIIIKHWTDTKIITPEKTSNARLIEKHTGVKNYDGREWQIERIMRHITLDNYREMSVRVKGLSQDDSVIGNSNFGKLIELLGRDNCDWIDEINNKIG